jgi:hypothetical protein
MMPAGDTVLEGNQNTLKEGDAQADQSASAQGKGFGWRAGHERNTTGIWVWSKPFIRTLPDSGGEKVAVLVMDTQGMFDGTLSQQLTASIFGLSTLFRCEQRGQRGTEGIDEERSKRDKGTEEQRCNTKRDLTSWCPLLTPLSPVLHLFVLCSYSSYQIYNVQNRIQEDNLQHLALFTEYGRVALSNDAETTQANEEIAKAVAHLNALRNQVR